MPLKAPVKTCTKRRTSNPIANKNYFQEIGYDSDYFKTTFLFFCFAQDVDGAVKTSIFVPLIICFQS